MSARPSITPPLPTGGNGKYIAAVALLLLIVVGLIYWKTRPAPVVATPTPPPSSSVMVLNNVEDDIPPPVAPDAGIDSGPRQVITVAFPNQCDAKKCGGFTGTDLESALAQRARQAHRCYDQALAQDPTLRGNVQIAVRVGANGSPCSAAVASNDLANATVSSCVAGFFRSGGFPPPKGGCVDTIIPIKFVPRQ